MLAFTAALTLIAAPLGDSSDAPLALRFDRVLTVNDAGQTFAPGMIVVDGGRIEYVGEPYDVPAEYATRSVDGWAVPGMVDLHSHIVSDQRARINDMVLPINADLSTRSTIRASNRQIKLACASGVTTLFMIPGSGTSISGFGVLFKTRTASGYEASVMADPGGMKVAQTHNPERRGGDLGITRAGLYWTLTQANRAALSSVPAPGIAAVRYANLKRVLESDLPVLIHCAGSDGVSYTARMWREEFPTRSVLSHGSFDGWRMAAYVASLNMPVNHGPRTQDYYPSREGRIVGSAAEYVNAGVPLFSLNTDAPVIPAWELFLQGTVSARQGVDGYQTLRALTIHPARSFGIDDSVGSLEVGKHADIVVFDGDPLDPRSHVECVWIEGDLQYDRRSHGQWF